MFRSLDLETTSVPDADWNHRHLCVKYVARSYGTNLVELKNKLEFRMKKYGSVKFCSLEEWEETNNTKINITNKESYWIAEYDSSADAEKAFRDIHQSSSDLHVSKLPDNITKNLLTAEESKKTNQETDETPSFFQHIKKYPRVNRISIAIGLLSVLFCSIIIIVISFRDNVFLVSTVVYDS